MRDAVSVSVGLFTAHGVSVGVSVVSYWTLMSHRLLFVVICLLLVVLILLSS